MDKTPVKTMLILFAFRVIMQLVQVHFMYHPDENWQSLEVAYNLVYGKDVEILLSWEWYPFYALRNHLYPFWLSLPVRVLKMLYLDSNLMVVNSMYLMHCIVWSAGDYYFYKLAKNIGGTKCAIFTTMISLTN